MTPAPELTPEPYAHPPLPSSDRLVQEWNETGQGHLEVGDKEEELEKSTPRNERPRFT